MSTTCVIDAESPSLPLDHNNDNRGNCREDTKNDEDDKKDERPRPLAWWCACEQTIWKINRLLEEDLHKVLTSRG